jgi:plastocyanin
MLAIAALAAGANAEDIAGTITIHRKLTRRSVTAAVSVYDRGAEVKLGKAADEDPLDFERSHVAVYLERDDAPGTKAKAEQELVGNELQVADKPQIMEQRDRQFSPDFLVVPAGAAVSFPNMDPIFHNIFSLSKAKSFDLGSYDQGKTRKVVFSKPGIVSVYCHLHPNMAATIVVTPSRWYARSDVTGHFHIPDVPPGRYTVVAWHKTAGYFRKSIVVEAGQQASVNFLLPLNEDGSIVSAHNALAPDAESR